MRSTVTTSRQNTRIERELDRIKTFVGGVNPEQLKYVDFALSNYVGIFTPIAGPCYYSISPEHTHPAYSFIITFDRHCEVKTEKGIINLDSGKMYAFSPGVPHQEIESENQARYLAIFISKDFFEEHLRKHYSVDTPPCYSADEIPSSDELVSAANEFMTEYDKALPGYAQLLEAAGLKIIHLIIRRMLNIDQEQPESFFRIPVNRVIEFMHTNYGEPLSVIELARIARLSPSHFSREFKSETGQPPMEYLHHLRLDRAKRMLLAGEKTLTEIALDCGFNSSSYFSSSFLKKFRLSPSDFRRTYTKVE